MDRRETVAVHFHAPDDISAGRVLEVADTKEIRRVMWMPVHQIRSMYASHKMWVDAVARDMASVGQSFTSQAVSAVAAHPLVSAVVVAACSNRRCARAVCKGFVVRVKRVPFFDYG